MCSLFEWKTSKHLLWSFVLAWKTAFIEALSCSTKQPRPTLRMALHTEKECWCMLRWKRYYILKTIKLRILHVLLRDSVAVLNSYFGTVTIFFRLGAEKISEVSSFCLNYYIKRWLKDSAPPIDRTSMKTQLVPMKTTSVLD